MKRNFKIIILSAIALTFLFSCNKEKDKDNPIYSTSSEDQKADIEEAALDGIDQLELLKDEEALVALEELINIGMPGSDEPAYYKSVVNTMVSFKEGKTDEVAMLKSLADISESTGEISQFWIDNIGEYTYNPQLGVWEEESANAIIFKFPVLIDNTYKDVVFTISALTGEDAGAIHSDLAGNEIPSTVAANLTVDGVEIMTTSFIGEYSDEPSIDIDAYVTIGGFKLYASAIINTTEISEYEGLSYEEDGSEMIIIERGSGIKGSFTESQINATLESEITEEEIPDLIDEYLDEAWVYIQLFNIKASLTADINSLVEDANEIVSKIEPGYDEYEGMEDDILDALNAGIEGKIAYADVDQTIATAEIFYDEDIDDVNVQFNFADGSSVDADVYYDEELVDVVYAFEDFIESFE